MIKSTFKWIKKGRIAGSAKPVEKPDIDGLYRQGIRAVVSLEGLSSELSLALKQKGVEHLVLPVEDGGVPTPQQAKKFLKFTEEQIKKKHKPVLVHCAAGLGRTGLMLALYLVNKGVDAKQAIDRIGTSENAAQREFVLQFASESIG
ncbi:MAG: dual specificity protein phosphatase family protein [Candidatus Latescibacteria bacterium]|nr:dual specificity protein phosphatase family protein [Candidatus Latescibacterota bacterium]